MSGHNHIEDDTEGIVLAKGVSMVVLFCASMFCGLFPLLLARRLKWMSADEAGNLKSANRVVMTLLSFGGGVLLWTTFMHLMPEVEHNIVDLQMSLVLPKFEFSLTPLLTCCGFFIMYLVEELVHVYIHRREKQNRQQSLARNLSIRNGSVRKSGGQDNGNRRSNGDIDTYSTLDLVHYRNGNGFELNNAPCLSHSGHGHAHMPVIAGGDDVTSALRGLLIVLGLSIHELFEGLAVGLESSSSHVWYMLGAISAHKLVIAFCIGVDMIATRTKFWLSVVYITTFAVVSPLGIGIGILLVGGQGASAAGVPSVILQGLASGTLQYVIFFEIWKGDRDGILQYVASVVGFFLMFGLQLLTPHSHGGHDHGHSHDHHHRHGK